MSKQPTIQNTYYDALFFATASMNDKELFYLPLSEYRLLEKLIHYSKTQSNITWSSENIANHLFSTPTAIDKAIQRLRKKGYINISTTQRHEKVKLRTIFINWELIESVNQMSIDYYDKSNIENELKSIVFNESNKEDLVANFGSNIVLEEKLEPTQYFDVKTEFEIGNILEPFVMDENNIINENKFDRLYDFIDEINEIHPIKYDLTKQKLNFIKTKIENDNEYFNQDEIKELLSIISEYLSKDNFQFAS